KKETAALRAIWALHAVSAFDEETGLACLKHASPAVRAWAVRLLGDQQPSPTVLAEFVRLAEHDEAPEVRLQLASSARHLRGTEVYPLVHALLGHKSDAADPYLPLM